MVATITFNPTVTTNALGSFNIQTSGYVQGTALDSPNARYNLAGGVLATTETLPMWGGVGISEAIPGAGAVGTRPSDSLGGIITRATTLAAATTGQLTGFSVFDQDHAMINTPQSPVPQVGSGGSVHFYRIGSGARIAVACDPSLVSLEGNVVTQNVSWDFNNQVLQPYDASTATYAITSMTWSSTNGGQVAVVMGVASPVAGVGDVINVSGVTSNSGTGGISLLNGNHAVNTFTDNQHFTFLLPGTSSQWGTIGLTSAVLNYGTGALGVKVLDIQVGNSMTVSYDPTTGFLTWNRSGTAAIILI